MLNLVCGIAGGRMRGRSEFSSTANYISVAAVAFLLLTSVSSATAQQTSSPSPFKLEGQVGLAAEAYSCRGIPERRAPTSSQLFANTQFNIFGLKSGLNLLYSTDDTRVRQSMNRLAFTGEWRWLQVSLGDVSPMLTKYSLSGVTVRGGLLELTPGKFMVTLTGGRTQRAVAYSQSAFGRPSFAQWLYAARIGVGSSNGTHFHLIGVLAREQVGSLDEPQELAPAENFSVTPDFGFSLFQGRFTLQANATAVVFTQDTRTAEVDLPGLPGLSSSLFRLRRGSRLSFAGEVEAQLRLDGFSFRGGYERVEPGFQTLGVGYVISDHHVVTAAPTVTILNRRLTLGGTFSWSRNNLLGQRLATLTRMQWGTNMQARIGSNLTISAGYQQMDNANRPVADSLASLFQDQLVRTFMVTPNLVMRAGSLTHSLTLSTTYQKFTIALLPVASSPLISPNFDNVNSALTYSLTANSGLTFSLSGTYLRSNTGATDLDAAGVTLGSGVPFFQRKLRVNVSAGWSQNWSSLASAVTPAGSTGSTQWMMTLTSSLQVTRRDAIRLNLRGLNSDLNGASGNFKELQATLRYDHRF
ncbi:MAG: hypothetical protein HKN37_00240 [Rhodothermales bacterium]|nr:hypothetical protein [Rhodothermales bacterium]